MTIDRIGSMRIALDRRKTHKYIMGKLTPVLPINRPMVSIYRFFNNRYRISAFFANLRWFRTSVNKALALNIEKIIISYRMPRLDTEFVILSAAYAEPTSVPGYFEEKVPWLFVVTYSTVVCRQCVYASGVRE